MTLPIRIAVASFLALALGHCRPSSTCDTTACASGARSYQTCVDPNGTETYGFGGTTCECGGTTTTACSTCTAEVASYCGAGGDGGAFDAGAFDAGGGACTAVFSGVFSSTYSPCAVTITYTSSGTTIGSAGNALPGTSYTWNGFSMLLPGMPATGTFDQTSSVGASDSVQGGSTLWEAGYGQGQTYGTMSVTITSLGPSLNVNGATLYQHPHGTVTATLLDESTQSIDLDETVTF